MKLEGDYLFEAPVQEVWDALMDPVVLAAVMPGCDKLELVDGQYLGELNIKIGLVQGKFTGKVDLKDVDAPKGYSMVIDGRGASGFVKATARVKLEASGTNTKLSYDADAQVGGKVATIGQRLLDTSAKAIAKQSLEGLHENIKLRHRAAIEEAAAELPPPPEAKAAEKAPAPEEEAPVPEGKSAEEKAPAPEDEAPAPEDEAPAPEDEAEKAPAPRAEPASDERPKPKKKAPPPVVKVDQAKFAAGVAKEVSKSLIPPQALWALVAVVLAVVVWILMHQ
jgi:YD repeat-containing protein